MDKLSFNELCNHIRQRIDECQSSDKLRYLVGYLEGYRDACGYKNITNKNDKRDLELLRFKISEKSHILNFGMKGGYNTNESGKNQK